MNNDYLLTQYTVIYNSEIVLASQTQKRTRRFQNTKRLFALLFLILISAKLVES